MSNIAFITTRKHIKSYNVLKLFGQINESKFDGKFTVLEFMVNDIKYWTVSYNPERILEKFVSGDIEFYIKGKRKFGSKHPHSPWMSYVMNVFHNEFGILTNGTLSDEGIEEHWAPVKDKFKSYSDYVNKMTNHYSKDLKDLEVKYYMDSCPKEMRDF